MTDAGYCHIMAANSVSAAIAKLYPDQYNQKVLDLLKESDVEPFNNSDLSHSFFSQNTFLETAATALFNITNTKLGFQIFNDYVVGRLYEVCAELIQAEKPDLVISYHFENSLIVREMKRRGEAKFRTVNVVVDPVTIHRAWADPLADLTVSPSSDAVSSLVNYGVDASKIVYPLFPLKLELRDFQEPAAVREELGFDNSKPVVLVTGGGVGTNILRKAVRKIVETNNYQVIVVAGRLEFLRERLEERYAENRQVKVLGFVNNLHDYMNAADVVIAKPSSATIMELEVFNKKAIFSSKVGGQDQGNPEYIQRNPLFRYIGDSWDKLDEVLDELVKAQLREPATGRQRQFDEAEKIAQEVVKLA